MNQIQIKGTLWMEVAGLKMGTGRARLLEKIREHGSISKAAQLLNISYRQAWSMVNEMNKAANKKIVVKSVGGNKGGGTILTKAGENLLQRFNELESELKEFKVNVSNRLNRAELL